MVVSMVTATAEILIVEDDVVILDTLAYNLLRQRFGVLDRRTTPITS